MNDKDGTSRLGCDNSLSDNNLKKDEGIGEVATENKKDDVTTLKQKIIPKKIIKKGKRKNPFWEKFIYLILGALITQIGNYSYDKYLGRKEIETYNKSLVLALGSIGNEIDANTKQFTYELEQLKSIQGQSRTHITYFMALQCSEWEHKRQIIEDPKSGLGNDLLENIQVIYRLFHAAELILDEYIEEQNRIDDWQVKKIELELYSGFREQVTQTAISNLEKVNKDIVSRRGNIIKEWDRRKNELKDELKKHEK
ncbi:MAG: hypothetical protein PHE49_07440 [bacterium]|nr:hypothetical protein [bacterium]